MERKRHPGHVRRGRSRISLPLDPGYAPKVDLCRPSRSDRPMPGSSSSRRRRRAIIIGGSMSGLFAAAFLRQIGWDADVYERSAVELIGRGAGITTHPELLDALEKSGAGTRDLGVSVETRIALDRA